MIPKVIHYCWFGRNPLPDLAVKCIASWRKFLPDYEIKEWNEDNFDVNANPYTMEAYAAKKYAFVSDYARFLILYKYGGVYFDTDVEVIKPIKDIVDSGPFMGFERDPDKYGEGLVAPGLGMACEPEMPFIKRMMDLYNHIAFKDDKGELNQKTICEYTTEFLREDGLSRSKGIQKSYGFKIYPSEYFAPIHFITRKLHVRTNTRTIHWYMASWTDQNSKNVQDYLRHYLPEFLLIWYNRLKNCMLKSK